jgi:energy-coupling factor transport system ATP-binding protein
MENTIIKTENISYSYLDRDIDGASSVLPQHPALKNVSVEIKSGEYVAVLGHNGSGKSTFAKLLNLILECSDGKIYIDGTDISNPDFSEDDCFEIRKKVGMVFQNPDNQLVATVVREDVAFGPENLGLQREEIKSRIMEAIRLVGMEDYLEHAPHKLSGGQKQRVAIAGIVAMKPKVIIFDEATAMLDPTGRLAVIDIMENLNKNEGVTVINITHYMEEAARADRVIVINDGCVVLDATPKEAFWDVELLRSLGLEAPQPRELLYELSKAGIITDNGELTVEECERSLLDLIQNGIGKK